jgi:hypothetical protein
MNKIFTSCDLVSLAIDVTEEHDQPDQPDQLYRLNTHTATHLPPEQKSSATPSNVARAR